MTGDGSEVAPGRRRRRLWIGLGLGAVAIVLALAAYLSWSYSSLVLEPDHADRPTDVTVLGVTRTDAGPAADAATAGPAADQWPWRGHGVGRIVLSRDEDSERPGVNGLIWQGGHAMVGEAIADDEDSVTRLLLGVDGYLVPGMKVAFDNGTYFGDPREAVGVPYREVAYRSELGPMPAWLVPGRSRTWAIVVHGINGSRDDGVRLVPALHRAGLPTLLISYRDDPEAPASPDGFHHMGLTEWRDLQAAARYALGHGARRLVLVGYSMGGSVVSLFMQRSPLASRVAGLVLDAPALDWKKILAFNAEEMGLPGVAAKPVELAIGARIDVDWDDLDASRHPEAFQVPILLFHGDEDKVVPTSVGDEFAAALPRWVEYHRVPRAGHTDAWNVDPARYERQLLRFLARIGAEGGTSAGGGEARAPQREEADGEEGTGPVQPQGDEEQARQPGQ